MDGSKLQQVINKLCEEKGVTQSKALEECGVGKNFIWSVKNRGSAPSVEKLQALALYFDVSVDYLIGNTDIPEVNREEETLSQAGLRAFASLSPAEQEQIRTLVETLAKKNN